MARASSPGDRRAPTIRKLAGVSLAGAALLTLIGLGALVGSSFALRSAMDTVTRDTRSAALASELEVAVLMHQRLSNLHVLTGEPEIDAARKSLIPQMQRVLVEADGLVGADEEQRLLDSVSSRLDDYLEQRRHAEAEGLDLAGIVKRARPAFSDILSDLRSLRELNDTQVLKARSTALRLDRVATVVGATAAAMLILGFPAIAWGVRRFVLRPVVHLHQTIARFRAGELDERAATRGVHEVNELARMFNDMAASLVEQRKAQLTFLAGVAHDLKNPLSTLKTGMYTLAYEPSEVRRSATRASLDRQVDLLTRMVGDLLDATRIEAGQLELQRTTFDLRRLVHDVVGFYVPTAPDHQLTVRMPDDPVLVDADGLRIEQVLRNLLSNAIKFSPFGGPVDVVLEQSDGEVVLRVSDCGVGMTHDDLESIFLPFRRRRLNVASGAGLGLSVVRRIVTAHRGTIAVESTAGEGSTFRVTLPRAPDRLEQPPAPVAIQPQRQLS